MAVVGHVLRLTFQVDSQRKRTFERHAANDHFEPNVSVDADHNIGQNRRIPVIRCVREPTMPRHWKPTFRRPWNLVSLCAAARPQRAQSAGFCDLHELEECRPCGHPREMVGRPLRSDNEHWVCGVPPMPRTLDSGD